MATPLKVGLAGLGTVGASVVRLVEQQRAALTLRCGRPIEIVAVTARNRAKSRGIENPEVIPWVPARARACPAACGRLTATALSRP